MILNDNKPFAPWVYDPRDDTLEQAADKFTAAVQELLDIHAKHGIDLYSEHVFPVLLHPFTRAGWTPIPKILKESVSPVYIACALGAALQYDKELWITPDLWGMHDYPGHSVEEYRSALLLAYHMGADAIYTENIAYDGAGKNKGEGSLIKCTQDSYQVTDYGQAAKWFFHEYVPQHPRSYTFRQVKPRVAIIRQPDACWGQKESWLGDRLFGNDNWPSDDRTEAWLKALHLLTLETVPKESLCWQAGGEYKEMPMRLLFPLEGLVVYDHHLKGSLLEELEVIFLTGIGVSDETLQAIAQQVKAGATCIAMHHTWHLSM